MSQFGISDIKEIKKRLLNYLRKEFNNSKMDYDIPPTKLLGGYEALNFQFQLKNRQNNFNKRLVLRIYPEYVDPDYVRLVSCVHNVLAKAGFPVAKAHLTSVDKSILGGAFFIMDFLPGKSLLKLTEPSGIILNILGKTHAGLHKIDPEPLIKALNEQRIPENKYNAESFFKIIEELPKVVPHTRNAVNWVLDNRQSERETLAICHGDFHANNILIQDGQVSGILDWHLMIADPAYDVARSVQVISLFLKVNTPKPDWPQLEVLKLRYLSEYQSILPLDNRKIIFGRVVYSLLCLMFGASGQQFMRHPVVVKEQIDLIHEVTGIRIPMPEWVDTTQACT